MDDEEGIVCVSSVHHEEIGASLTLIRRTFLPLALKATCSSTLSCRAFSIADASGSKWSPASEKASRHRNFRGCTRVAGRSIVRESTPDARPASGMPHELLRGRGSVRDGYGFPGSVPGNFGGRGRVPRDIVTLREPRGVLTVFVVIVVTCSKGTRDTRNKFPSPSSLASSPMQSRAGEEEGGGGQ